MMGPQDPVLLHEVNISQKNEAQKSRPFNIDEEAIRTNYERNLHLNPNNCQPQYNHPLYQNVFSRPISDSNKPNAVDSYERMLQGRHLVDYERPILMKKSLLRTPEERQYLHQSPEALNPPPPGRHPCELQTVLGNPANVYPLPSSYHKKDNIDEVERFFQQDCHPERGEVKNPEVPRHPAPKLRSNPGPLFTPEHEFSEEEEENCITLEHSEEEVTSSSPSQNLKDSLMVPTIHEEEEKSEPPKTYETHLVPETVDKRVSLKIRIKTHHTEYLKLANPSPSCSQNLKDPSGCLNNVPANDYDDSVSFTNPNRYQII